MKFLTYMITSVAALDIKVNPIEDGQPCGTGPKAVKDAAGNCKSNKCNAVPKAAATTTRRLAEAAAAPPTCLSVQEKCLAIKENKDETAGALVLLADAIKSCRTAPSCKWVPTEANQTEGAGSCEADCKCSGTTVVSVTVAFVAAILLL